MIPSSKYNWKEFKDYCFEAQFHPGTIFRGQSNSEWHLATILPEAKRLISGYIDYDFELSDKDDRNRLISLLQHHGFPTPLMDWTFSPYIAAYFAFIDLAFRQPESDFVAIWLFNAEYTIEFLEEKDEDCPFEIIHSDSRFNKRLLAQDGLFSLSLSPLPLDEELFPLMEKLNHPGLLQKFVIPVEYARLALKDLELMGIHAGRLFEGVDGACMMLKNRFFMESEMVVSPRGSRFVNRMITELADDENKG